MERDGRAGGTTVRFLNAAASAPAREIVQGVLPRALHMAQVNPWTSRTLGVRRGPIDQFDRYELWQRACRLGEELALAGADGAYLDVDELYVTSSDAAHLVREAARGKAWAVNGPAWALGDRVRPGVPLPAQQPGEPPVWEWLADYSRRFVAAINQGLLDGMQSAGRLFPPVGTWGMPDERSLVSEDEIGEWAMAAKGPVGLRRLAPFADRFLDDRAGFLTGSSACVVTLYANYDAPVSVARARLLAAAALQMRFSSTPIVLCVRPVVPHTASPASPGAKLDAVAVHWWEDVFRAFRAALPDGEPIWIMVWEGQGWDGNPLTERQHEQVRLGTERLLAAAQLVWPEALPEPKPEPEPGPRPEPGPSIDEVVPVERWQVEAARDAALEAIAHAQEAANRLTTLLGDHRFVAVEVDEDTKHG